MSKFLKVMALSKKPSDFQKPVASPAPGDPLLAESVSPTETEPPTASRAVEFISVAPTVSVSPTETEAHTDVRNTDKSSVSHTDLVPHIESVSPTEAEAPTDSGVAAHISAAPTVSVPPTETVPRVDSPKSDQLSAPPSVLSKVGRKSPPTILPVPPTAAPLGRSKPRQAIWAQDGHSHAEQAVYAALWDRGTPVDDGNRLVTIGFGKLSNFARLSENNCRLNVRSLIRKFALKELKSEISAAGIGKTYLVYSYSGILERRRAAGMNWVIRTKGVAFVDPLTGREFKSVSPTDSILPIEIVPLIDTVSPAGSRPAPGTESGGGPPTESAPLFRNSSGNVEESSSSQIADTLVRLTGDNPDDDAIRQLVETCRQKKPDITVFEISALVEEKLRTRPPIKSTLMGFLISAVPKMIREGK